VAIEGNGFFKVTTGTGSYYTRSGNFNLNDVGQIVMGSATQGWVLDPTITIPQQAVDVVIATNGEVSYRTADQNQLTTAGQIQLSTFINPDGLLKLGDNLYQQTDASGQPTEGIPGTPGIGTVRQGSLEASNVEPVQELIDLITTQRAFELNSQVVQAGDQIMQVAANLRRY
jgi:flagellar basal-body rod protein FlgG